MAIIPQMNYVVRQAAQNTSQNIVTDIDVIMTPFQMVGGVPNISLTYVEALILLRREESLGWTSIAEINVIITTAPASALLRTVVASLLWKSDRLGNSGILCRFILDWMLLVLPFLLCTTLMADHSLFFVVILFFLSALIVTLHIAWKLRDRRNSALLRQIAVSTAGVDMQPGAFLQDESVHLTNSANYVSALSLWTRLMETRLAGRRPFITGFRAYVNIATAICILAIDFSRVYPKRLGKIQTYGTGLMDVGVGLFIVSNGLVSPEARDCAQHRSRRYDAYRAALLSFMTSLPLWLLGTVRAVLLTSLNYHHSLNEYGVHWNFFFSLAAVRVLSSIILCFISPSYSWFISIFLGVGYQWMLSCPPLLLRDYILLGGDGMMSRDTGFIDANREGLLSCFGYLSIYFAGVQIGIYIMRQRFCVSDWCRVGAVLTLVTSLLWLALFVSRLVIDPISRRMANLPYVLWIVAFTLQLLTSGLIVDMLLVLIWKTGLLPSASDISSSDEDLAISNQSSTKSINAKGLTVSRRQRSRHFDLLEAVNRNALFYFVLANLLTGLVNITFNTHLLSTAESILILVFYTLILSAVTAALHIWNVTVKCW